MKLKKWWVLLIACMAAPLLAALATLSGADVTIDWILIGATFCFSVSLSFSFTFALGYTIYDLFEFEQPRQENSLDEFLSLLLSLPTLMGCFLLLCDISWEVGMLFGLALSFVALVAYYRNTTSKGSLQPPDQSEYVTSYLAPLLPLTRAPLRDISHYANMV